MVRGNSIQRQGQGTLRSLAASFCARVFAASIPRGLEYRALAHLFMPLARSTPTKHTFFGNSSRGLTSLSKHLFSALSGLPSTHIFFCKYRASAHISTVLPHILYRALSLSLRHVASRPAISRRIPWPLRALGTVLSPTFSPFFQSLCYRAFSHVVTVSLPTKFCHSTVLSPTKVSTNTLNSLQTLSGKDVLKTCIKKTSRLMMIFILKSFSSSRRSLTA